MGRKGGKEAHKNRIVESFRSHGIELTRRKGTYLFAKGPIEEGYFMVDGNLDYAAYDGIVKEGKKDTLKPPHHVYGNYETYQDKKNIVFHRLSETLREITKRIGRICLNKEQEKA